MRQEERRRVLAALAAAAALPATGCVPLMIGGAIAGTAMSVSDRRATGIQIEDQNLELKLLIAFNDKLPSKQANVSATSYNLRVLLTGEVATAELKAEAQSITEKTPSVAFVFNELYVGNLTTLANRNYDTALTAKVRAAFVTADGVPSATVKVVTSRSVVYLMGLVTEAEGETTARVASRVAGVQRVVKVFEFISEKEAAALTPSDGAPPKAGTAAPSK